MAYSLLTRLFEDKAWRLSRTAAWLIVGGFVTYAAIFCGGRAWSSYDRFIANDGTTLIYAQFARNLLRYPLSETSGLMADLVGNPAGTLIAGARKTFYADHPPGLVWLAALVNRFAVADPVVAARVTSIIASIGTGVALLAFVYRRVSPLPAVGTTLVLLTLSLFWEHAIVGNFEPVTAFFMVGAAIAFAGYLRQPTAARLAATALWWVAGMLCDWPAYLLGAPFAAALLHRWRWGLLVLFTVLGAGTMATVFAHLVPGGTGMSVTAFFYGAFHHDARHVPFLATLAPTFNLLLRGFWWWALFLMLPLLRVFRRRAEGEDMRELRFVFIAFLFAGLANDLLFNQWAKDHSFWSYYLIPAACLGSAITFQRLHETHVRSRVATISLRAGALTLFLLGAVSSGRHMVFFVRSHFYQPTTMAEMLDARGLKDMLDRDSVLLVPAYCQAPLSPNDGPVGEVEIAPRCDIYVGWGSLARYAFDRPAIPASNFDSFKARCNETFAVVKGPGMAAKLAQLAMTATEIPWFDWHVLRLSQLAPRYCEHPARIFTDLSDTSGKDDIGSAARGR
jgi:hypothetical protein